MCVYVYMYVYIFMCKKHFTMNFVEKEKPKNNLKMVEDRIWENYNFSIILDKLLPIFTNTWTMKSQRNCATRSQRIVGLLVNLEPNDTTLYIEDYFSPRSHFYPTESGVLFVCLILQNLPPSARSLYRLPPAEDFLLSPFIVTYHWCYNGWFTYSSPSLAVSSLRAKTKAWSFLHIQCWLHMCQPPAQLWIAFFPLLCSYIILFFNILTLLSKLFL